MQHYSKESFFELIKFSLILHSTDVKSEMEFFRKRESRIALRQEFSTAIRPVFLKYLLEVDKPTMDCHFSKKEKETILNGYMPDNWSVHHQKPLSWGGRNFNAEMLPKIMAMPLTKEQEQICQNSPDEENFTLRYKLDNFLSRAQKKGKLKEVFIKLFKHHLILMPHHLHEQLEENHLMPQVEHISELKEELAPEGNNEVLEPLSFPVWDQFVYQGQHFTLARESKIRRIEEDCIKRRCLKRKNAYLRAQRQKIR